MLQFPIDTGDIQYLSGFGLDDVVGWGTTGLALLDVSSDTIIKTPLDREQDAPLISPFKSGIRLEYASNHHLRSFNKKK